MKRLVVVGNGMAGARVVEEILKRAPDRFDIVMFGAEPYGNYNRILLSNVLNGSQAAPDIFMNPLSWYRDNGITLHAGVKATRIDRERRVVVGAPLTKNALAYAADAAGDEGAALVEAPYDHVIIATGVAAVCAADGWLRQVRARFSSARSTTATGSPTTPRASRRAAVIGGGLLGLEAARGLLTHEVDVTVLEAAPQLMMAQLDSGVRRHAPRDHRRDGHQGAQRTRSRHESCARTAVSPIWSSRTDRALTPTWSSSAPAFGPSPRSPRPQA